MKPSKNLSRVTLKNRVHNIVIIYMKQRLIRIDISSFLDMELLILVVFKSITFTKTKEC